MSDSGFLSQAGPPAILDKGILSGVSSAWDLLMSYFAEKPGLIYTPRVRQFKINEVH